MLSETDIVAGYQWLLGRLPRPEEIAQCRGHFSQPTDEVIDFQHSLLQSDEFRNRRLLLQRGFALCRPELDRDRLAFVHIEKCGGTTLHAMLCTQFPPEQVCPERDASLGDWTINELARFSLFSGHFDRAYCASIPGRVRVLTMLREPKKRLFSLYRFWKSHRPHPMRDRYVLIPMAREMDAAAFFSHDEVRFHTLLRDGMAGQLTRSHGEWSIGVGHRLLDRPGDVLAQAIAVLDGMAGFGILERFEDSRRLLNAQLGLDMPEIAPRQVLDTLATTDDDFVTLPPEPVTPEIDALLDAMTEVDRPFYDHACAVFSRRMEALDRPRTPGWRPVMRFPSLARRR
ncbi:sulfotransferase family 2 domain-containing protein [Acetobacteraceae bacterium KSS8]|uniref:Sulfotransferase family 2 domain-containing protein n=1 Tax=Endosaccharibacter trunci TaxID=2812733 RepID=A0ABT1W540_9PROT|nr:sulfotransferase family 2 domain-containing protein [Acetobacteraceae bacterium KSS8]